MENNTLNIKNPAYTVNTTDVINFSNIAKGALSKYTKLTYVAQYVITENSVALFVNPETDSEMIRDNEEMGAVISTELVTLFGLKSVDRFNDLHARIKFSSEELMDYFPGGVISFTHTSKGVDLLYTNSNGELKLWKNKKNSPKKSDLANVKTFVAEKWTDGGVKDVSVIGVNTGYFQNEAGFEAYLDETTSGQHSYYKDSKMSLAKFSEMVIRQSTDVAPSKNLHKIASEKGIELLRVSLTVRLAKQDKRDGSMGGNAVEGIAAYNAVLDMDLDMSAILSAPQQARIHRSNKSAVAWHRPCQLAEIIASELAQVEGATHHIFTYEQIEQDEALRQEIKMAFDKDLHNKATGLITGTRFKVGDAISLYNTEDQEVPTFYMDMNTVKAVFDPLCKMGIIVMQIAQTRELSVKVSGQAMMTPFIQNKDKAVFYAYNKWMEFIDFRKDKLTNPQATEVLPHRTIKGNFHYNTVVTQGAPQMLLKDKKLFNSFVEKQLLASIERDLGKNAVLDVDGMYAYGIPDFGHYFGVEILRHNEVASADFATYRKRATKAVIAKIEELKSHEDKAVTAQQKAEYAAIMENLTKQLELLKNSQISMYRSPKMSIYEMDIRTVLSIKQICKRIDAFVAKGKITEVQGDMLKDMYQNIKFGAIYMSADIRITKVHSGSDWDIDAFTCIYDAAFNTMLTDIQRVMVSVK